MSKVVAVTGGAGYIGSHICKELAQRNYYPIAIDDMSCGNGWAVRWGPLVELNLKDVHRLTAVLRKYSTVGIIHCAGSTSVADSFTKPLQYFDNNTTLMITLLKAATNAKVRCLVFSSSAAVYGLPQKVPISENHPLKPVSPYGASKAQAEIILNWFRSTSDIGTAIFRYFNAAGADPEGEIGEYHRPETHLIPSILEAILGSRPALDIYGVNYATPDGTAIRDYVHVTDLAKAHVDVLESLWSGSNGLLCNLGSGQGWSVGHVIEVAEKVTGRRVPVTERSRRPGDPPVLVAETELAQKQLGWRPQFSLEDMVLTAWEWMKKAHAS